ncbi:MAG: ribosome assembly cofactor RimP [Flavobacteriales bacterium]|nr:ribosome assembly cofactor RimP [Flavobacteriales bacterium]|tara:strand:- start:2320 stop:2805 length:486 start_codon:yes stop_codon:yes gene_type:complete
MIPESKIKELVQARIEGTKLFIVDINVSLSNKINVLIDGYDGVTISDCIDVSRGVEHNLDREAQDFELEVSSAGLDAPFAVSEQYKKNLGKEVKVYTHDGRKHEGELCYFDEEKIIITYQKKIKIEGRKKKEWVTQREEYFFESSEKEKKIRDTKVIISFK